MAAVQHGAFSKDVRMSRRFAWSWKDYERECRKANAARARANSTRTRPVREGKVPCRCGEAVGLVPDWFGRNCIEGDCPLRHKAIA